MDYEKNQNLGEQTPNWDISPERDSRALGNRIISTSENFVNDRELVLGEIAPIDTPQNLMPPTLEDAPGEEPKAPAFDPGLMKEEKGKKRIGKEALKSMVKIVDNFNHDGNAAKLNDDIRNANKTYLKGSFNRDVEEPK